ncbi:hypothetical protein [Actinoplanes sp. N902-109]|uniref:hypothetical protein n=1 Tax=Actinoplanes sp. (strain N902-109) TaxID=649831 RepID=UPI000329567B|nr:hypothetical protein [Actinoplanes sp. N902-109]AGL17184.1 hypothetical protein L083_3674 [Actinoplanes sp. N902-109]
MTAFRHEARHSIALAALPLLLFAHCALAVKWLWPGTDVWLNMTSAVVGASMLSGPMVAGIAAWVATRERRRRTAYLRLTSARSPFASLLLEWSVVAAVTTFAYLVVAAVLAVKTAVGATTGGPDLAWLATGLIALLLIATAGYALGRFVPKVWTPPLAALLIYLYSAWDLRHSGSSWSYLSPVTMQETSLFRPMNHVLIAGQAIWYLAIMAVLAGVLALVMGALRPAVPVVTVAAGLVGVVVGGTVVLNQHGRILDAPSPVTYTCSATAPQICIHPAFAKGLPRVTTVFLALHDKVAGTPADFTRLQQLPRDVTMQPAAGSRRFALDSYQDEDLRWAIDEYLSAVSVGGPSCAGQEAYDRGYVTNVAVVRSWLTDDVRPLIGDRSAAPRLQWFSSLTEQQRREWFRRNYPAITGCTLADGAFGGKVNP